MTKLTPASSAYWVVQREQVLAQDGFEQYKLDSYPEISIQGSIGSGQLVDSFALGVGYEKRWLSQFDTSVRLLKPLLGKNGWYVWLVLLFVSVLPWMLVAAVATQQWLLAVVVSLAATATCVILLRFYAIQWASRRVLAVIVGPLVVLQEAAVIANSYYRYMRGQVTWKGRDIELHAHR